jgi:hypothetical protein
MVRKRVLKQSITLLVAFVLVFSSLGMTTAGAKKGNGQQEVTYSGDGYEVIYKITSSWGEAFNADVTIMNNGDETIDNWALGFVLPNEITKIWNGLVQSREDGEYVIKNTGNNQDIAPGKSVKFGFTAKVKGELVFPDTFDLLGTEEVVPSEQYETNFKLKSDWNKAFNGEIRITNTSETTIEDWKLSFDFEGNIERFSTAEIIKREGNRYLIKNAGHNANIEPGETVRLELKGNPGGVTSGPSNVELTQIVTTQDVTNVVIGLDTSGMEFQNSADGDYYFLDTVKENLSGTLEGTSRVKSLTYQLSDKNKAVLQQGNIVLKDAWSVEGVGFGVGYNLLTLTAQLKNGTKVTNEYIIVNFDAGNLDNIGIDREKDTDTDGVPDYYEERFGLSPTNKDTDGDGLGDLNEILALRLNPLEQDSDKNGTLDGDEDSDNDGLSNLAELAKGTSFMNEDTDGDGLTDGEEVHTYKTDPLKADTDGDELSDGWEVTIESNPLVFNEKFTRAVKVEDENAKAVPSVTVEGLTAEQVDSLSVNPVEDGILNDTTIPGYIDNGYNFSVNGAFEKATLSFQFDEQLLDTENFVPRIYYFNEESQGFEELQNQKVEGNVVSVETEHFSKYILLNKTIYDQVWVYKLLYDEDAEDQFSGMDIAFVIDSSGSMTSNDRNNVRIDVTRDFISKLTDNDRGAVVDFDSTAKVRSVFTNDKDALSAAAGLIDSSGGTNLSSGITSALNLFDGDVRNDVLKYIIMLTDGQGSYDTSLTTRAAANNVVIYTVGLGSSVSSSVLTAMATGTGGGYYHASNADQLAGIFDRIAETSDLYKDTDVDGISDYHEKEMAAGRLRLSTGGAVSLANYLNPDSDADGLKDGEEIRVVKVGDRVSVYLYSNPSMKDTDGDGLDDAVDKRRLIPDVRDAIIHQSAYREGILKSAGHGDSTVSDDLTFNDYTFDELVDLGWVFSVAKITPEFMIWGEMAALFEVGKVGATADMKDVLDDLVDTFRNDNRSNVGTSVSYGDPFDTSKFIKYKNPKLDNAVMADASTKKYVDLIHTFIVGQLQENNGDLSQLAYVPNGSRNAVQNYVSQFSTSPYPVFTEKTNLALSLAIHAFHGHNITIKDFKNDGNQFSGKIMFHFYDHFGLDADDEIVWPGFIDWFTLQHYDRFDGKYVPFITTIDYEMDFSGTIK